MRVSVSAAVVELGCYSVWARAKVGVFIAVHGGRVGREPRMGEREVAKGNGPTVSSLFFTSREAKVKKKHHLHIFISGESPTQLGGESRFSNSSLPAQYEDFPFHPREPLVDHRDRRWVLGRRFGLARRTDVLVRTPLACIHLARQVRFRAWTVVGCVRRHIRRLLYREHLGRRMADKGRDSGG